VLNPHFAKLLFLTVENLRGEDINGHLSELEKSQWYSPVELETLQWEKLKALLSHAYKNVPWYRKKFNERKLIPVDIATPEDLKLLPILTKADLRSDPNLFLSQNYKAKSSIAKSSGSTGVSVKIHKDRKSSGYGRAAMFRGHRWHGINIGDKEAKLWGVPIRFKERMVHRVGDFFLNRFRELDFSLTDEVMMDFYRKMKKKDPKYMMGYPSMVYQFARFIQEKELVGNFDLKIIKVTSETLYEDHKSLMEQVFECPVINEYGASETGLIGFECPSRNMHLMSECVFVEEENIEGLAGSGHEFIVTDLNNYTFPIIRFMLGDIGSLSVRTCDCGRGLPLIESIQGRVSDIVYKADGTAVHSSIFSYLLKEITKTSGDIKQYKAFQDSIGSLKIEIVRNPNYGKETEDFLKKVIRNNLGSETKITIDYVNEITRDISGKLRYFESRIK